MVHHATAGRLLLLGLLVPLAIGEDAKHFKKSLGHGNQQGNDEQPLHKIGDNDASFARRRHLHAPVPRHHRPSTDPRNRRAPDSGYATSSGHGLVDIQAPVEGGGYGADGDGNTDRVYLGCFDKPARSPFFELTAVENLTREVCFEKCASAAALYFGVLEGSLCGCGDDPDFLAEGRTNALCDIPCTGSASETCGGDRTYDLYLLTDGSHDGGVDVDIPGSVARPPPPGPALGDAAPGYVGCFDEPPSAAMDFDAIPGSDEMTPMVCFETCDAEDALFFALSAGNKCVCGFDNDFDASELFPVPCDTPCSGDASVTCGGDRAYDLYELGGNVPLVRDAPEAADDDAAYEAEYEEEQEEELYVERLHEHYAQMEEDQMDEMDEEEMYEEALDDMPVIGGASVASGDDAEYEAEYEEEMNEEEMYEEALDDMPVIGGASVASGDEAEYELYEEETKDVEMYLEEMDEEEYQEYQEEMEIGDASEASVVSVASVGDEEYEAEYEADMYEEEMDEEEEYAEEVHEHYAHMDEDKMDDMPVIGGASVASGDDAAYEAEYEMDEEEMYEDALDDMPVIGGASVASGDDAAYEAEYEMGEMDEEEMYEEALDDMPVIGGASVASGDDAEYEAEYEEEMNEEEMSKMYEMDEEKVHEHYAHMDEDKMDEMYEEEMYEEALDDMPVIGGASVASGDEAEYELYEEETKDVEMYLEEMDEEEYQEYQEEMEIGDASEASVVSVASVGDAEYEAEYEEDMYEEEMDEEEEYAEEVHEHYAHMDEDKMDDMPVMGGASVASGDDAAYEAYEEEMYEEALDDMPVIGGASVASGDDEAEYEEEMYEEELHEHYAHMDEEEMYEEEMYEVPAIGGASVASGNDEAGYEEEMYEEMYEEELVEHKSMSGSASAVVFEGCYWTIVGEIDESNTMSSAHMTPSMCLEYCLKLDSIAFVLYEGVKCMCDNDDSFPAMETQTDSCDKPCGGDVSFSCGGRDSFSLYEALG